MIDKLRLYKIVFILFILFVLCTDVFAIDRCKDYVIDVRNAHTRYFGNKFPYWYAVGQIKQESSCRSDVTAFDKGQGLAQFMPATSKYIQGLMKESLNPYNAKDSTKMQAFYMYKIHSEDNWSKKLFITYQIYNGGKKLIVNEFKRSKELDWQKMKNQCRRNKVKLNNGKILDLCEVNYDYSKRIYRYGEIYKSGIDDEQFKYW